MTSQPIVSSWKKFIFFIVIFIAAIFLWIAINKDIEQIDEYACNENYEKYVDVFSDKFDILKEDVQFLPGDNNVSIESWVVALDGRSFLCFSEIDSSVVLEGVEGLSVKNEKIQFEISNWKSIPITNDLTVLCTQLIHEEKLQKYSRFVKFTINTRQAFSSPALYWLSEGHWKTKCQ